MLIFCLMFNFSITALQKFDLNLVTQSGTIFSSNLFSFQILPANISTKSFAIAFVVSVMKCDIFVNLFTTT